MRLRIWLARWLVGRTLRNEVDVAALNLWRDVWPKNDIYTQRTLETYRTYLLLACLGAPLAPKKMFPPVPEK